MIVVLSGQQIFLQTLFEEEPIGGFVRLRVFGWCLVYVHGQHLAAWTYLYSLFGVFPLLHIYTTMAAMIMIHSQYHRVIS